jgi:hypothetical protein
MITSIHVFCMTTIVRADRMITKSTSSAGRFIVWFLWGFIGIVIWVAIAFWPARVAARKGHSFIGYFLLSLLFFPLALIMAYAVHDRGPGLAY